MSNIENYISEISNTLKTGGATEHSHRPALKTLLEESFKGIAALNEPKRQKLGAPDFIIIRKRIPIGYIETKDVGIPLDIAERSEQLHRYLEGLENLILTNYLEFRWYVRGELRMTVKLGNVNAANTIKNDKRKESELVELLTNFINQETKTITSAKELATRMATLSKLSYEAIKEVLDNDHAHVTGLYKQFGAVKETLIHDLTEEKFADMLAQTISYGLFTAKVHHTENKEFSRMTAAYIIPKTNPFLRDFFGQVVGPSMDENLVWIVEDLVKLLDHTNINSIINDFGKKFGKDDPIIHFYETFLDAYRPEEKAERGVYYTPSPVVDYIVRSVDYLLINFFDLKDGIADTTKTLMKSQHKKTQETIHKVQILDPAVGTGTFLSGVIDHIQKRFEGQEGMWPGYVQQDLLPRLNGFELLMSPYTIAHMKMGLKLTQSGYNFEEGSRLKIYLTNSLEKPDSDTGFPLLSFMSNFITGEAEDANTVKKDYPVMIVLGNPPYNSVSANNIPWIKSLMRGKDEVNQLETENYFKVDGQPLGERNTKWINDDYVKFIRFSQWKIEQTGYGVLAFITPHGYLDNPTFKGMRQSLMNTFDDIYILDLHGNANKLEGKGNQDQNVFQIMTGVSIGIFVKTQRERKTTRVFHQDLFGNRASKFNWLNENSLETTDWQRLTPKAPLYLFVPEDDTNYAEYEKEWSLPKAMPIYSNGIVTARDKLTIGMNKGELKERIEDFAKLEEEEARSSYRLGKDVRDWQVKSAQQDLIESGLDEEFIQPILYRPFDVRYTYYTGKIKGFICMPRREVMTNMLRGENLAILSSRMTKGESFQHLIVTDTISEAIALSSKTSNNAFSFPLYEYKEKEQLVNFFC